jgi:hypothetical protein
MSHHDEYNDEVLLYLDNALTGDRLKDFRAHIRGCAECKERLEQEQALSLLLRETRPLYVAPLPLRDCIAAARESAIASAWASDDLGEIRSASWKEWLRSFLHAGLNWKPAVALTLIVALCLLFVPETMQRVRATEYVEAATEIHKKYISGDLPLECRSASPDAVTTWFAGKTPFPFRLPSAQFTPAGKTKYSIAGASLVSYKGKPAAMVAYEMGPEKITLLAVSAGSVVAAGGEEVRSGELIFHYRHNANFAVTTWSNRNLTYALVSSSAISAQNPCLVCHQDMADHLVFEHVR